MSDVFELPLMLGDEHYNGWSVPTESNGSCFDDSGDGGFTEEKAKAIVHAVNCHNNLVDDLTIALGRIKEICHVCNISPPHSTIERIEKTLAKAKGDA